MVIRLLEAMIRAGFSTAPALETIADTWRDFNLHDDLHSIDAKKRNHQTLSMLKSRDLVRSGLSDNDQYVIQETGPFPCTR